MESWPGGALKKTLGGVVILTLVMTANAGTSDSWIAAIDRADLGTLHRLVAGAGDVDTAGRRGKTALMVASSAGDLKLARSLLDLGADPNRFNEGGGNALMYAAQHNQIEAARLLIQHGARVNDRGGKFWSPLMIAVLKGHLALVELLLAHSAEPDARDMLGATPLIRAVERGRLAITRRLLATGAVDLDAADKDGVTALHLAAVSGDLGAAQLLLDHGASTDVISTHGQTPADVAARAGHDAMVNLLRRRP